MISLSRQLSSFYPLTILLMAVMLLLGGCAATASAPVQKITVLANKNAAEQIGRALENEAITVNFEDPPQTVSGRVSSDYFAASGKRCKKFQPTSGVSVARIACRDSSGDWYLQRALALHSGLSSSVYSTQPGLAAAKALTPDNTVELMSQNIEPVAGLASEARVAESQLWAAAEDEQFRLALNESLSGFSQRTTGHAKHWPVIARYNDISQPDRLRAGTLLRVPADLRSAE